MKVTVVEIDGKEQTIHSSIPKKVKTLGDLLKDKSQGLQAVQINGEFTDKWESHVLSKYDHIKLYPTTKEFSSFLVFAILSLLTQVIASFFLPKPKKPDEIKSQPSWGVAGIQNTIAPGTPKFFSYGQRRVYGHLIASTMDIETQLKRKDTGRLLNYSVLYYMGQGPVKNIAIPKINLTHLCDIEGPPEYGYRLGTSDQTIFPRHELIHQVYFDGRELDVPQRPSTSKSQLPDWGRPITYTTKGDAVNEVTIFTRWPSGIWSFGVHGSLYPHTYYIRLEYKRNTDPPNSWTELPRFESITTKTQSGLFWKLKIEFPEADQWDFRISILPAGHGSYQSAPTATLYNVEETQYIQTAYPNDALLEIHGIANDQIQSLDSMEASALVEGRLVDVPYNGLFTKTYTRNRVWIIRDIMTNATVGLGNRISSSLLDEQSWIEAADYYEQTVTGFDAVTEQRDFCDVILNDAKPGWDWIKTLLFEGRAIIIPSGGSYKYLLDKDKPYENAYSAPGNIIENSLKYERGSSNNQKPINTVKAEFSDASQDYKSVPAKLVDPNIGEDPERPEEISFVSLTRESQVSREMNFFLKKHLLIKRRWNWKTPQEAVESEPFDIVKLSYNTPKHLRGYSGVLNSDDSTTTSIDTGRGIYLAAGITHSIFVKQDAFLEERRITNTTGTTYSVLTLSSALSFTPTTGDIWGVTTSLGTFTTVQIENVELEQDQTFSIRVHEHVPEVYDDSVLVNVKGFDNVSTIDIKPIPLLDAQAIEYAVGSTVGFLFNVVSGFDSLVGTYSSLSGLTVTLATTEPAIDDYFNNAYIIADGEDPKAVVDYIGSTNEITVGTEFLTASTYSGIYEIYWEPDAAFYGFAVEGLSGATWEDLTSGVGTSITYITGSTYSSYRFTPFAITGASNTDVQITTTLGQLDFTPPQAPLSIMLSTDDIRTGIAEIQLEGPLERDLQYINVEFMTVGLSTTVGTTTVTNLFDVSGYRDESNTASPISVTVQQDLSAFKYGTVFEAKANTIDFFGNASLFTYTLNTITLTANDTSTPSTVVIDTTGSINEGTLTGGTILTLFSQLIDGGTIGTDNSLQLDLNLSVTPGSTATTSVTWYYVYGGITASEIVSNISDNSTAIADLSPYWLTFYLEPINANYFSQYTLAKKVGTEVPENTVKTSESSLEVNSNSSQYLSIYALITGDTSTEIIVNSANLQQIIDQPTLTNDPYTISGTVPSSPTSELYILIHPFITANTFPTNVPGSFAVCTIAPSVTVSFDMIKIPANNWLPTSFGSMTFSPGVTHATFTCTETRFEVGSVFMLQTPNQGIINIENIGYTIYGAKGAIA